MDEGCVPLIMDKKAVGLVLCDIRAAKKKTQIESGKGIGISQSLLSQYESGKIKSLNKRTLIKILDFYRISPKYFEAMVGEYCE